MPTLFESGFAMTKDFYQEIFSFYSLKRPTKIIRLVIIILVALLMLWLTILDSFRNIHFDIALGIQILLLILYFTIYPIQVNVTLKRNAELSKNAPISCTISATENSINYNTNVSKIEIEFSNIKKAFQTKNYIMLVSNANLIYSFRKDNFTVGSAEDFLKFLRSKGYKL